MLDQEPGWPQPAPLQVEGDGLGVFDEPSHSAGRNGAKRPPIRGRGVPSARIGGLPPQRMLSQNYVWNGYVNETGSPSYGGNEIALIAVPRQASNGVPL